MKRYTLMFFLLLVIGSCSVAAINIVIDPFGAFGWCLPRTCTNRTEAFDDLRRTALVAADRIHPSKIIVGSSTALTGLSFNDSGWDAPGPARGMAVTGGTLQEAFWMVQYANRTSQLQQVVLGLDFYMANMRNQNRMDIPSHDPMAVARRYLELTFSKHAIQSSLASLHAKPFSPTIDDSGQQTIPPQFVAAQPGGFFGAFEAQELSYMTGNGWFAAGKGFDFVRDQYDSFAVFRALTRYCHEHHIRLYVYLSPSHARFFSALKLMGLEPYFLFWKAELARINDEEARRTRKSAFPLWDFSVVSTLTTEPLPRVNGQAMTNFVDSSHFSSRVGTAILGCLFHPTIACDQFGALLRNDTFLMPHLEQSAHALTDYMRSHSTDLRDLQRLKDQAKSFLSDLPPPSEATTLRVEKFARENNLG